MTDPVVFLQDAGLLDERHAENIQQYLTVNGGSLLNAIASQVELDIPSLWETLATIQDRPFIRTAAEASPIDGTLLHTDQVTQFLVLGRSLKFTTLHLMTPDPLLSTLSLMPLAEEFAASRLIPGGAADLRVEVCTPSVWKSLYHYTYPNTPYTPPLTDAQAVALASLTPQRAFHGRTITELYADRAITPEQYAEAYARQHRAEYINIIDAPPDPALLAYIQPNLIRTTRSYPYLRINDAIVTVSDRLPSEYAIELYKRLHKLTIIPAIISRPSFDLLLEHLHD